jgi:hypothetical protein
LRRGLVEAGLLRHSSHEFLRGLHLDVAAAWQQRREALAQLGGDVAQLARADRTCERCQDDPRVALRGVQVDLLARGDAAQELVDLEGLRPRRGVQPRRELGRELRRKLARFAPRDPLGERLQRRAQRPLGALAADARGPLDELDDRVVVDAVASTPRA